MNSERVWQFKTKNFLIAFDAEEEFDLDLSFDDTGEVREKIEDGEYVAFCAVLRVYYRGSEIASEYLGQCIHESADDFRDHIGIAEKSRKDGRNYGSYFSDMVREAIREARKHLAEAPRSSRGATFTSLTPF